MREYQLADIIDIKHGFAFNGEYISANDNGIVLVTPGNFKIGGGFQEDKCKFFCGEVPKEYILKPGAFIVTMTDLSKGIDTLGYSAIIPKHHNRLYLHNQRIGLVDFISDECDKGYIYYLMQTHTYQRSIANSSTGSTVHHTSPTKIKEYCFVAPELSQQRKIAKILSAYDDLIENNQKQIKLLEEAAQRLYKEWFVDLRFPGYETTPMMDGVPEGWKLCCLEDVIEFNPKTFISKEQLKQNVPMSALNTNSMILNTEDFTTTFSCSGSKFQNGDTLLARITPCLENGKTAFVSGIENNESAIGSTEFIVMRSKGILPYMVYLLARTNAFRQSAINSMTGSDGRQRVQVDKLKSLPYLKPTDQIMRLFAEYAEPMFMQIQKKNGQSIRLRQARDRLLPKLMSGEIEV